MKLFKPISVLLLTLFNITQAFYLALDDGKATTGTSKCLRLNGFYNLVIRDCSAANQFSLANDKLCLKSNPSNCLSTTTSPVITIFSKDTNRHIANVKEFNEAGGYLHVDATGGEVKKYKYSQQEKAFVTDYVQPLTFPSSDGHWKFNAGDGKGDLCWTGKSFQHALFLNPCRTEMENKNRGNKNQLWKYEFDAALNTGRIKSTDGVMCLISYLNRVYTEKCNSSNFTWRFNLLHGREIAHRYREGMCLVPRLFGRKIIKLGPCARRVKLVSSL